MGHTLKGGNHESQRQENRQQQRHRIHLQKRGRETPGKSQGQKGGKGEIMEALFYLLLALIVSIFTPPEERKE